MNVRPEQLAESLKRAMAPVYLLAGAEPLILQECRDAVLRAGRAGGFLERDIFHVGRGFDWQDIRRATAELSLFSPRRVADVRLPSGKPGQDGGRFLADWAEIPEADVLLIVSCGEWDSASRKSAWASKLASSGVLVEIWPVRREAMPKWIDARMRSLGLEPEPEGVQLLAELSEGNLLAAQQEIEKLALTNPGRRVSADMIAQSAADSARFSSFQLGECLFAGNAGDSLRVAASLKRTGVAIQAVTAALLYQLNQLESVQLAMRRGENEAATFGRLRVIKIMQPLIRKASKRLQPPALADAFRALALMDLQGKGQAMGDPWLTLDEMIVLLCAPPARTRGAA